MGWVGTNASAGFAQRGKILCRLLPFTGEHLADFLQTRLKMSCAEVLHFLGEQGYHPAARPLPLKERFGKVISVFSTLHAWFEQAARQAETVWNALPFYGEQVEKYIQTPFSKWWPLEGWALANGFAALQGQRVEMPLNYVFVLGADGQRLVSSVGSLWNIFLTVKNEKEEKLLLKGNKASPEINFLLESIFRCGLTAQFQEDNLPDKHIAAEVSIPFLKANNRRLEDILFILKQAVTGLDFYVGFPCYQPSVSAKREKEVAEPCAAPKQAYGGSIGENFFQMASPQKMETGFYEVTEGFSSRPVPSFVAPSVIVGYIQERNKNLHCFIRSFGGSKTGCMVVFPSGGGPSTAKLKRPFRRWWPKQGRPLKDITCLTEKRYSAGTLLQPIFRTQHLNA